MASFSANLVSRYFPSPCVHDTVPANHDNYGLCVVTLHRYKNVTCWPSSTPTKSCISVIFCLAGDVMTRLCLRDVVIKIGVMFCLDLCGVQLASVQCSVWLCSVFNLHLFCVLFGSARCSVWTCEVCLRPCAVVCVRTDRLRLPAVLLRRRNTSPSMRRPGSSAGVGAQLHYVFGMSGLPSR